jgi:hypothetical protein
MTGARRRRGRGIGARARVRGRLGSRHASRRGGHAVRRQGQRGGARGLDDEMTMHARAYWLLPARNSVRASESVPASLASDARLLARPLRPRGIYQSVPTYTCPYSAAARPGTSGAETDVGQFHLFKPVRIYVCLYSSLSNE